MTNRRTDRPLRHYRNREVARAFGIELKTLRLERELSQEALADLADIDRTYPSLLERGERGPSLTVILALSFALGVNESTLVKDTLARLSRKRPVFWPFHKST